MDLGRKWHQVFTSLSPLLLSPLHFVAVISQLSPLLSASSTPSQSHISKMQIWSCHFSVQKLLLPTAYRLESKLINMQVDALEKLALTHLLALFLNVIFPNPSWSPLCEPLHMQLSHLEFPAVRRGSVTSNRKLDSNRLQQWSFVLAHRLESQEIDGIHARLNKWLIGMAKGLLSCHPSSLPSLVFISIYGRVILG